MLGFSAVVGGSTEMVPRAKVHVLLSRGPAAVATQPGVQKLSPTLYQCVQASHHSQSSGCTLSVMRLRFASLQLPPPTFIPWVELDPRRRHSLKNKWIVPLLV